MDRRNFTTTGDPNDELNAVCSEGWELIDSTSVFIQTGQETRDKLILSGQNVATAGTVVGYYVFKRNEAHRHSAD